jgi:integrase
MSEADCGNTAGALPSGGGVVLDSPHGSDASGEAFGQENARPDATADLDLPVEDTRTAVLGPAISVSDMVGLATSHLRSPHSKRAYRQAILEFVAWCTCIGTTTLNRGAVLGYVAELNRLRMSPATINVALCAIRRLASELTDNRLMSNEDGAAIMRIKGPRRRGVRLGNWLSAADAERLLHSPDTNTTKGKRDRAILAALFGAGLRRSEAAQLSVAHLQRREGRWVIVDLVGKHDRIRSVPIPDWTKHDIDEWIAAAGFRSGPLFRRIDKSGKVQDGAISSNAIYEIVRQYATAIGVEIAPHDARRTFAKLAHLGHAGLDQIQLTLGHSSILTTERYLGVLQNLSDAPCDHLGLTI